MEGSILIGSTNRGRRPRRRSRLNRLLIVFGLTFLTIYTGVFFKLNNRALGGLITWAVTRSVRGQFNLGRAHYGYWGGMWSILTNQPTHVTGGDFEIIDPDGNVVMRVPHVDAEIHLQELIASLVHYVASKHFHLKLHFKSARLESGFAVIAPTRSSFGTQRPEMNIVAAMSGKKPGSDDYSEFVISVERIDMGPIDFAIASSNAVGQASWVGQVHDARARAALYYSSSRRKATADGPAFWFALRDIDVPGGELVLGDFVFPLSKMKGKYFGTIAPTEKGSFSRTPAVGAPDGFGARQRLSFNATATTLQGAVQVDGALLDAYGNRPSVQLRLEVEHAAGLAKLLPEPISGWISGDPRGAVTVDGPFSDVGIGGELDNAIVDIAGLRVTRAGGRFKLGDKGLLVFDELRGELARGRVRGEVDVRLVERGTWRADIDASNVDPAALPPVPASLRALVAGKLGGHVHVAGGFGKAARSGFDIEVSGISLERTAVDALPAKLDIAGKTTWTGSELSPLAVKLDADGLALEASGKVSFGKLPSTALDFSLAAHPGPWLDRIGLPRDVQIDHAVAHGHVAGPFAGLEGAAHVETKGVVIRGRRVDRAVAEVSLAGGKLRIAALTGEGMGASLAGHGDVALFDTGKDGRTRLDRRLAEPTISAELRADGANLTEVLTTVGIAGRADVDVALSGPLSRPSGHASLGVAELTLLGDRYRKGRLAFAFSDAGAKVSALHLERVDGGLLEGHGQVGWQGALDLTLDPKDFPLAAIPGVATLPVSILGTLSGKVHLGGDFSHPAPGGVIALVGAKIRDTLFGDGSLKLEPGSDAIHITGKFFDSYAVDGYLTLFPKISVAVTVKFEDIELERVFPEMRRLADVRGRASGEARITADSDAGLTFAGLRLGTLNLVLSGLDEKGSARRLVVRNQDDVTLSTNGHELLVDHCFLRSALGAFSIHGRVSQKDTDVELKGHIGLELLEYFFASVFTRMSGDAIADLRVRGDLSVRPALLGSLDFRRATLQPRGLEGHRVFLPSGVLRFEPDGVRLGGLKVELDGAIVEASGRIGLDGFVPGAIEGDITGEVSPKLLQWAMPDQIDDASGRIGTTIHLGGTWRRPEWRGDAQVKNVHVSLRRTGREVVAAEGTFKFKNYDIVIGCEAGNTSGCKALSGLIDDESRYTIEGKIGFGERLALRAIALKADIADLAYNGGDFAVRASPSIEINGDGRHLELTGQVNVVEGRYTRNYNLVDLVFSPERAVERPEPFWEGIALLEQMKLDVRAKSTGPLAVRNNIADLTFSADVTIGGTLQDPSVAGEVGIEQGGNITLPLCRFPFVTNRSQITFDPEKRYPNTPNLQISATGVLVSDRTDAAQNINIQIFGTPSAPQYQLTTQQGLQGNDVILMCVSGQTAEELRRGTSPGTSGGVGRGAPGLGVVQGGSTTEGLAKSASSAVLASTLDPLRKIARLDTFSLEFGATGIDVRACKRWTRNIKTCGQGEIGFIGGTRVGGFLEYRILDQLSVLGRGEYLTRGVETVQDSLTRGRLELNLRIPLLW